MRVGQSTDHGKLEGLKVRMAEDYICNLRNVAF